MPESLRKELASKKFGDLLRGEPSKNARLVMERARSRNAKLVVVGDFTLNAFLGSGFTPDLGIFDRKTMRGNFPFSEARVSAKVSNPAGQISDEAITVIRRLLASDRPSLLQVDGEEDLLSLTAVLYSPDGSIVVYGIPGEGMMVITINDAIKEKIREILDQFERIP